jgi:hypothetical protein
VKNDERSRIQADRHLSKTALQFPNRKLGQGQRMQGLMEAGLADHVWTFEEIAALAVRFKPCALSMPQRVWQGGRHLPAR